MVHHEEARAMGVRMERGGRVQDPQARQQLERSRAGDHGFPRAGEKQFRVGKGSVRVLSLAAACCFGPCRSDPVFYLDSQVVMPAYSGVHKQRNVLCFCLRVSGS